MKKRIICGLLTASMMVSSISVMAGKSKPATVWTGDYLFGEKEHIVDASDCIDRTAETDGSIKIPAGGSATWGFYLPYNSRSVTIVYTGAGNIKIKSEEFTYPNKISLERGNMSELNVVFRENSGREVQYRTFGSAGVAVEQVEHSGEKDFTILSDADIYIHELRFEKEITMGPSKVSAQNYQRKYLPEFSYSYADGKGTGDASDDVQIFDDDDVQSYGMNTMTTVLIREDAPIIVVNGGKRYIDNNNVRTEPYNYNGSMYLPVETLAKALGYYSEVIPEKGYALMRSDTHEVVLLGGKCYVTEGQGDKKEAPEDVFIYRDGQILAAVRYFGELTGETVGYRDGLVVIDDKYTVRDILEEGSRYNELANDKFNGFTVTPSAGNTYYVAPSATNGDGTYAKPYTLSEVYDKLSAGDTVILKNGTYREVLSPTKDGSPNNPITFKAETKGGVKIMATDKLAAPTVDDAGKRIYSFDISNINNGEGTMGLGKNQVFVDNVLKSEARYPDPTEENVHKDNLSEAWGVRGDIFKIDDEPKYEETNDEGETVMRSAYDYTTMQGGSLLGFEDNYWKGGIYVGTFANSYAVLTGVIESSTDGSLEISDTDRTQMYWWENWSKALENGPTTQWNYGMIIGHKNAMNLDYEWVVEDDALKMILPEGTDTSSLNVEMKSRQLVIDLRNKKYINIEGIDTFGGSITMDKSTMCMLNNMDMKYISHYTLNADPKQGYIDFPLSVKGENAPQRGEVGIYLGGTDDIIVNSHIDHSAGAGIYITGAYSYIDNNIINDCGYMGSYVSGITIETVPYESMGALRGGLSIYNNTIYNSGRGCLNINKNELSTPSHGDSPLVPMDIAYNDFHDGCLMTEDAGILYCHGRNTVFDKKASEVHHNYVYSTVAADYSNPYCMLIYWDGSTNGMDTYNNLTFVTGAPAPRLISTATATDAESYSRLWNNHKLGNLELDENMPVADALSDEYFSEDRPFFAGSHQGREKGNRYLNNYNRIKENEYTLQYRAADATPSSGNIDMEPDDGYIAFTENGQSLTFNNVDFGTGTNEMVISYRCDANWTYDEFELTIGSDVYNITLPQQEPRKDSQTCTHRFAINPTSGIKNVILKVTDYYSARIGGLSVYKREVNEGSSELYSYFTYMSQYSGVNNQNVVQTTQELPSSTPYGSAVKNTLENTILRYANVTLSEDADYFVMAAGSRDQYRKQPVYVYVCEPTENFTNPTSSSNKKTPVAKFVVYNQKMLDITPIKVPITNADGYIKAGTYDIYLEFRKETLQIEETSTILYCGFLSRNENTTDIGTQVQYQGGLYDDTLSIKRNPDKPFLSSHLTKTSQAKYKLSFITPGDTVGYSDIDVINYDCDKIKVSYMLADRTDAGKAVTVRVASYDSETSTEATVATGTLTTNTGAGNGGFYEQTVTLSNSVTPGNYRVYFDFPEEENPKQNYQIGWFRFEENN